MPRRIRDLVSTIATLFALFTLLTAINPRGPRCRPKRIFLVVAVLLPILMLRT